MVCCILCWIEVRNDGMCVVTSTAEYSKVLSSMENALIMLEMAAKCSNYAKNWGLCLFFWIMLFAADYAKNYASILYQCLACMPKSANPSTGYKSAKLHVSRWRTVKAGTWTPLIPLSLWFSISSLAWRCSSTVLLLCACCPLVLAPNNGTRFSSTDRKPRLTAHTLHQTRPRSGAWASGAAGRRSIAAAEVSQACIRSPEMTNSPPKALAESPVWSFIETENWTPGYKFLTFCVARKTLQVRLVQLLHFSWNVVSRRALTVATFGLWLPGRLGFNHLVGRRRFFRQNSLTAAVSSCTCEGWTTPNCGS